MQYNYQLMACRLYKAVFRISSLVCWLCYDIEVMKNPENI
jgi:hypothetical protein